MKPFTIFLILLGLLVVITVGMAVYKKWIKQESFVNFQNQPQVGTKVYIPQYSTNQTSTVLSLYDNLYIDPQNGSLIEVFAPPCSSGCDTTGQNITDIIVASRDGKELTSIPTVLDGQGKVKPYPSPQSLVTSISQLYNQFIYTTSCQNTDIYQVVYVSWYSDTYIHIIDLSSSTVAGTNVQSIHLNSSGVVDTQTTYSTTTLAPFTTTQPTMALPNNLSVLNTITDSSYTGTLTQLGSDANGNMILYDISSGNIVIKTSAGDKIYNRNGSTGSANTPLQSMSTTTTFAINDISGVSVLVSAYKNDTVVSILVPNNTVAIYKLLYSYRFNQSGYVSNAQSDVENTGVTPAPTSASTISTSLGNNSVSNANGSPTNSANGSPADSSVCGDDLSCKWYWYFNTIAQSKNGVDYLSDDYFLKTEAIPPVCPQCPQCPSTGGACTTCGGNGGAGTITSSPATSSPATSSPTTNPPSSATLPPGAIKDNSGNTFIPYTDASGNTRYVLYSAGNSAGTSAEGPPGGNLTMVDQNGQFVTTSDPNTIGGGLAVSTMSLDQLGTSAFNNAGSVANNVVNTAGNVVGGTVNAATGLVGGTVNAATGLVGGTVNAATGLVSGVANTAANLVGGTIGTAADLAKDAGSGLGDRDWRGDENRWNKGWSEGDKQGTGTQQQQQQGGQAGSSLGYTPFASTSDRNFGNMGTGPVDNYSYYGAVQSKGGNYMPVTADFSAFSK